MIGVCFFFFWLVGLGVGTGLKEAGLVGWVVVRVGCLCWLCKGLFGWLWLVGCFV